MSLDIPSTASESHGLEEIKMDSVTIQSMKAQRSLMEWSQRVADCRNSGQPVTRWCAEHGINPKTYYNWQKKVFAAMVGNRQTQRKTISPPEGGLKIVELR